MKIRERTAVAGLFVLFMCWGIYQFANSEAEVDTHHAQELVKWREANRTTKAGILCQKHQDWQPKVCENVAAGEVTLGMNAEQVRLSWGKPSSINETQVRGLTSEQWVYSKSGTYLYLDNGVLTSWQTPK